MMTNRLTKCSLLLSVSFCLLLASFSCNSPNESTNNLTLSVDVSCTEAWLNIKTSNVSLPQKLEITRNGETEFNITISANDTTIYDDGLSPNKNYTYQAVLSNNQNPVSSNRVSVITLDTTSHNFTWQTFTFGDAGAGSSVLNDIAIINDTLAYAVGEVYMNDYTGNPDLYPYCLAKWNGKTWSFKKLYYKDKDYQGNEFISVLSNIRGILAFNNTDIWFAAGSIFHWNGIDSIAEFSYRILTPSGLLPGINKLWGNSNNNIYGVGNSGSIVHYTNGSWQKKESGTSLNFYGLFGNNDEQSGQTEILAVGSDVGTANGSVIVKIDNQNAFLVSTKTITGNITTIWFIQNRAYYVGSGLPYNKHNLTDSSWRNLPGITQYAVTSIYGNSINDVFITSSGGEIVHFNGVNFRSYSNQIGMPQIVFSSIKSQANLAIAVGFTGTRAAITVGRI